MMHTLRIKILSLQVSLGLVTNKELDRLVLTQEFLSSALRQLALISQDYDQDYDQMSFVSSVSSL